MFQYRMIAGAHTRASFGQHTAWLLFTSFVLCLAACQANEMFTVEAGQVRALVPGRDTTAGYFKLTNNTADTVMLTGATSPLARAIEIHESYTSGEFVRMRPLKEVIIAPGETVTFEPGGKHLMIFGTKEVPETFPLTLIFNNGEQWPVTFSKLSY